MDKALDCFIDTYMLFVTSLCTMQQWVDGNKITLPNARQQGKVVIANLFAEMKAVGSNASYRIVFLDQGVQYTLDLSPAERDYLYTQEADLVEGAQQKVNEMLTKPVSVPEAEIASLRKPMLFRAFSGEPAPS